LKLNWVFKCKNSSQRTLTQKKATVTKYVKLSFEIFVCLEYFVICCNRADAKKMEEWARSQNGSSLVEFSTKEGEVEAGLKDISERAGGNGNFSYSRFFAVGLFRLLELANAPEPSVLEKVLLLSIFK
jgi:Thylakoid formation protein